MAIGITVTRLTETLRDSGLAWLLPNLRQDFVIWNTLIDPVFLELFVQSRPSNPIDFSPGKLAHLAKQQADLVGLEKEIKEENNGSRALQVASDICVNQSPVSVSINNLANAGVTAREWLKNYYATKTWNGLVKALIDEPKDAAKTPIACLFSYLEHPIELLRGLINPGSPIWLHQLAVHALLSNPLTINDQTSLLINLCHDENGFLLPPDDRLALVATLYEQNPRIAFILSSRWLEIYPDFTRRGEEKLQNTIYRVHDLLENHFQGVIRQIAGKTDESVIVLRDELAQIQSLYTHMSFQAVERIPESDFDKTDKSFLTVNDIHGDTQSGRQYSILQQAEFGLAMARGGKIDPAKNILHALLQSPSDDPVVLYTIATISHLSGDNQQALIAASKIVNILNLQSGNHRAENCSEYFTLVDLGKLLLDLDKPDVAVPIFEKAIRDNPNDADLLVQLADSYKYIHEDQKAIETLNLLVALYPKILKYHRVYARSLEQMEEWVASLNERSLILDANYSYDEPATIEDKYEYAQCAIKANQPGLTISTCNEIIAKNQDDSEALILTGEAYLQMGQIERGMEFLTTATQITPPVAKAWLVLSEAQKKIFPSKTVIETLKNASQAIPGSAQIHHTLGDLYTQDDEFTLALPEFATAVELSPDHPQYLVSYGELLQKLGHIAESREILSKAFQVKPEFPGLAQMYAEILINLGEIEEAILPLEILINSTTLQDRTPYLDYARCILTVNKSGKAAYPPIKALMALNHLLQIDPSNAEAKALVAEALTANGENELAFQAYREALETSLTEDKVWLERLSYGFGCMAISIGKYDTAIAALQEASQVNPNNALIFIALSDAYHYAKLPEDATKAARNVLIIDGENPDRLAWFASQVAKISSDRKPEPFNSSNAIPKEDMQEALSALFKAIQLEPTRADLIIQLGKFQSFIGERSAAQATFTSILSLSFITSRDMLTASKCLRDIDDHSTAIACLEKGIMLNQDADENYEPTLYIMLAEEYVNTKSIQSALNTLDRALSVLPNDQLIISKKVELLLGSGQSSDALTILEAAIKESKGNQQRAPMYFLASQISRSMGGLPAAVKYAKLGLEARDIKKNDDPIATLSYRDRINIAELYRALLQPEHGYNILQTMLQLDESEFVHAEDYLDFIFLHTELAIENGAPLHSGIQEAKLDASHPSFSRLMAIHARLLNMAGNYRQAEQLLEIALSNFRKMEGSTDYQNWNAIHTRYLNLYALVEASQELGRWDYALTLGQQLTESSPDEPITQLVLAQTLILEAEYIHLCEIFEVIQHKPETKTSFQDRINQCKESLDKAKGSLENFGGENILGDLVITNDYISRWRARAEITFGNELRFMDDPVSILTQHPTPGNTSALIHHLIHSTHMGDGVDNISQIIKYAHGFSRNPAVMLELALALHETNPDEALNSLTSVIEHNPFTNTPHIAFCNFQLAKLGVRLNRYEDAEKAIENALSFWLDEPGWHELAGQIYHLRNDIYKAVNHLQEAADLSPLNIAYHLELGKLLFNNAGDDSSSLTQSSTCFEKVLVLDPENTCALNNLARVKYSLGEFERAEALATRALGLNPDQVELYQLLSEIALKKTDYQGAYKYATKASQNSPNDILSSLMLAKSLSAMGRNDEAMAKLNTLIPIVEDAQPLLLERVDIIRKVNGPQIALNELKVLADAYPGDFHILDALAKSLFEVGELEAAIATAQQALRCTLESISLTDQANLHLMMGRVFRQTGQLDQAIQHMYDAIQLAPNRLEPYLELGMARKERREYDQALQVFERATSIAPNDPRAPFQAGLALKESKDYKSSESMLRRAVSLAPNDLTIRRQLAAVVALNLIHNPRNARTNPK